jgi:hypothetical protein
MLALTLVAGSPVPKLGAGMLAGRGSRTGASLRVGGGAESSEGSAWPSSRAKSFIERRSMGAS